MSQKLLTQKELAAVLSVSVQTVRRWKECPRVYMGKRADGKGSACRYDMAEVVAWLKENRSTYKRDKKGFNEVLCVRDHKGFKKGTIYAQVGWNNGSHVVRANENGDTEELLCLDGGNGDCGLFDAEDEKATIIFKRVEEVQA